ncbi:MAG: T9SS type A sorting domain-containing protein [candidate division WOR-3 bacterium]
MRQLIFVLMSLTVAASAFEQPAVPEVVTNPVIAAAVRTDRHYQSSPASLRPEPVWRELERMSPAERNNAVIDLLVEPAAEPLASRIEELWNSRRFAEALQLLPELSRITDPLSVEMGIAWREPVPTLQTDWGNDVRIGNRDSFKIVAFDIDRSNGNLFVAGMFETGSGDWWAIYISTNGGQGWSETYTWNATYRLRSLSGAVMGDYFYVVFGRGASQNQALLYRFRTSDGEQHNLRNGSPWICIDSTAANDSLTEISVISNQDVYDNRLYVMMLRRSDSLKFFWSADTGGVTWYEVTPPIYDAERGIDQCFNEGFDSLFYFFSFFDTNDTLEIWALTTAPNWRRQYVSYAGSGEITAIGAYHDTIICAFDREVGSNLYVRYVTRYKGDPTWRYGVFDDSLTTNESPGLTARAGGGEGVVYRFYTSPRQLRFTWRRYVGAWSTPVVVADRDPYWNAPGIEYLGSGVYGVVYLSRTPQIRECYFDRSDWTGVAEQRRLVMEENILNVVPNPVTDRAQLRYTLNCPANLTVRIYDQSGRMVQTVFEGYSPAGRHSRQFDVGSLPAGVYFVRADADGQVLTIPVTIAR